jgi:hypothetical protein
MPTFSPQSSDQTYTVPSRVQAIEFVAEASGGGGGGARNDTGDSGADGGDGGKVVGTLQDTSLPGETLTLRIGDAGGGGETALDTTSTPGGDLDNGPSGGQGGRSENNAGGAGGGGAATLRVIRDSTSTQLLEAGGGGGGGGHEGGGGGGGAAGGAGGRADTDSGDFPGEDAAGSGVGGDGGKAVTNTSATPTPGADGGGSVAGVLTSTTTTTGGGAAGGAGASSSTENGDPGTNGSLVITEAPRAPSGLTVTAHDATSVSLSWTDESTTEDGFRVEFRQTGASTWTEFGTVGIDVTSETVTGLQNGVEYEFRVGAFDSVGASFSGTVVQTTDGPAPTFDALSVVNGDELDTAWTSNSTNEDGFRVLVSVDGNAFTDDSGLLSASTTTYTTTEQPDGETVTAKIRAVYPDTTTDSGTKQATTVLPDVAVSDPNLDTGVEDEITATWTDQIDNGQYRIQHKATTAATYTDDGTVGQNTTSFTITGLPDGQAFDVRVRSETDDVTGTYRTTTATTLLPAPTALDTANESPTQIDITWTDEADNEDEYRVERRRQYDDGFDDFVTIATVGANTTSVTDGDVVPDETYEYRVIAVTEDAETPATLQTTTPGLGYGRETVSPTGWTVEVDRADTGATRRLDVVGDPVYDPSLNSLPEVRLPVAQDESLSGAQWEDAPIRVWRDGERLPIEQVTTVTQEPGRTVITAQGGTELLEPQAHEFSNTDVHNAAQTVIGATRYDAVVDAPSVDGGSQLIDVSDPSTFEELYQDPGPNTPVIIDDTGAVPGETGLTLAQTCFLMEAEAAEDQNIVSSDDSPTDGAPPNWSNDEAVGITDTAFEIRFGFELAYDIPSNEVGVALHRQFHEFDGEWEVLLDGTTILQVDSSASATNTLTGWATVNGIGLGVEIDSLAAGAHTLTVRVNSLKSFVGVSGEGLYVDIAAVFDRRFHTLSNFDDLNDGASYMETPALYPTGGTDALLLYNGFQSATGARVESRLSDVSGDQQIGLKLAGSGSFQTASNTETLEVDFSSAGADIVLKTVLDAFGDRSGTIEAASPTKNFKAQTLRTFELFGDIRDSAPLQNDQFNTEGRQILTALADRSNALWAVTYDPDAGIQVEVTNAGQRQSSRTLDLVDYSWRKQTLGEQVTWAVVRGGGQPVTGERFTAAVGSAVDLDESNLVTGREQVFSLDRSTRFERGVDYEMNTYQSGAIEVLTDGTMSDGTDYLIDYEFKPRGEFATEADPKKKRELTIVGAATDEIAKGVAFYLADELGTPIRSGEAIIDDLPPGVSVLDALALDPLPEDGTYHVTGIEHQPGRVSLSLASRERAGDLISDIRARLENASERV